MLCTRVQNVRGCPQNDHDPLPSASLEGEGSFGAMKPLDHQRDGMRQAKRATARRGMPPDGTYLTDGKALFHVERTLLDGPQGELFVELEDCHTLDLIFCSARSVAALGLRTVLPA